eukprot:scaffold32357_cov53-Phaeocystis_antarctica.AAC.4
MCGAAQLRQCSGCAGGSGRAQGLRTRRQWEGRRAVSTGLGRRLGQLLVGSRAFLGLRCCASDCGEGRLSWWRGGMGLGSARADRGAGWGDGENVDGAESNSWGVVATR